MRWLPLGRHKIPPEEVARQLMRESFGVGSAGTEMLDHALGSDRGEQFASIPTDIFANDAAKIVSSWKLKVPDGTYESIKTGGASGRPLFPWL
jgi:hypothetical protein